jgi:outer membrane protein OmpA-like peptidoglycan-associated protein
MGETRHSTAASGLGGGPGGHRARRAPRGLSAAAVLLLLLVLAAPAQGEAPERDLGAGIVVNAEVLNDLGRAAAAGPAPTVPAPALLPPPERMPTSRLLVRPLPPVVGPPPAKPRHARAAPTPVPADTAALAPPATEARAQAREPVPTPEPVPEPVPPPPPEVTAAPPATPAPPPPAPLPDPVPDPARDPAVAAVTPPETPPPPEAPPETLPAVAPPVPATPPPPAATPETAAPPSPGTTQSAALPPADAPERFLFAADSAELSDRVERDLDVLAARLRAEPGRRVQLLAYAGDPAGATSRARRLSLSRALAVRAFLVEKGIATGRIDVRALGDTFEEGPADRVDVVAARR